MTQTFGGSLQLLLGRFRLLDDTDDHPAGTALVTDVAARATYAAHRDGTTNMRLAFVRPIPEVLTFVVGGRVLRGDDGATVGWEQPTELRAARMDIDLWSINAVDGAVAGYYRWNIAEASGLFFAGGGLDSDNVTRFRAALTVNMHVGLRITAEAELPDWTSHGGYELVAPTAAATGG